jgi:Flp pilus assembly protein TadD
MLGAALAQNGDFVEATNQFAYVLLLRATDSEARSAMRIAFVSSLGRPGALQELASTAPESAILLSNIAWVLATHPEEQFRDGATAVRIAQRANALTNNDDAELSKSLAAAYAEVGKFDDATATAERAATLARSSGASDIAAIADEMLSSFRDRRAFREQPRR